MSIGRAQVCAVVVAHRPERGALDSLIGALAPQVGAVVVVSNDAPGALALAERDSRVSVLEMGGNLGVGAAQNRGIEQARRDGFTHAILFDQDSQPRPDMVAQLCAAWSRLAEQGGMPAAVGPRLIDRRDGWAAPFVRFGWSGVKRLDCAAGETVEADFLISSGMLAAIAVFDKVGPMDEGLFIDNTDLDWCFRARSMGLRLYGVGGAAMLHQIGETKSSARLFGREVPVYRHRPLRQYYIMRNRVLLYRRAYVPRAWVVQDAVRAVLKAGFILARWPNRVMNLRMMLKGLWDGCRKVSGEHRD
jgi:rhamnosyltransferase